MDSEAIPPFGFIHPGDPAFFTPCEFEKEFFFVAVVGGVTVAIGKIMSVGLSHGGGFLKAPFLSLKSAV